MAELLLPLITMLDKIWGLLSLLLVLAAVFMVVVSEPETGSSESSMVGVVVVTVESAYRAQIQTLSYSVLY